MQCWNCGAAARDQDKFCPECGVSLAATAADEPKEKPCRSCGTMVPIDSKFCGECGVHGPHEAPVSGRTVVTREPQAPAPFKTEPTPATVLRPRDPDPIADVSAAAPVRRGGTAPPLEPPPKEPVPTPRPGTLPRGSSDGVLSRPGEGTAAEEDEATTGTFDRVPPEDSTAHVGGGEQKRHQVPTGPQASPGAPGLRVTKGRAAPDRDEVTVPRSRVDHGTGEVVPVDSTPALDALVSSSEARKVEDRPAPRSGVTQAPASGDTAPPPSPVKSSPKVATPPPVGPSVSRKKQETPTTEAPTAAARSETTETPSTADRPKTGKSPIAVPEGWPDITDEVAEIRFYVLQGLEEDAHRALAELRTNYPGHPDLANVQLGDEAAGDVGRDASAPTVVADESTDSAPSGADAASVASQPDAAADAGDAAAPARAPDATVPAPGRSSGGPPPGATVVAPGRSTSPPRRPGATVVAPGRSSAPAGATVAAPSRSSAPAGATVAAPGRSPSPSRPPGATVPAPGRASVTGSAAPAAEASKPSPPAPSSSEPSSGATGDTVSPGGPPPRGGTMPPAVTGRTLPPTGRPTTSPPRPAVVTRKGSTLADDDEDAATTVELARSQGLGGVPKREEEVVEIDLDEVVEDAGQFDQGEDTEIDDALGPTPSTAVGEKSPLLSPAKAGGAPPQSPPPMEGSPPQSPPPNWGAAPPRGQTVVGLNPLTTGEAKPSDDDDDKTDERLPTAAPDLDVSATVPPEGAASRQEAVTLAPTGGEPEAGSVTLMPEDESAPTVAMPHPANEAAPTLAPDKNRVASSKTVMSDGRSAPTPYKAPGQTAPPKKGRITLIPDDPGKPPPPAPYGGAPAPGSTLMPGTEPVVGGFASSEAQRVDPGTKPLVSPAVAAGAPEHVGADTSSEPGDEDPTRTAASFRRLEPASPRRPEQSGDAPPAAPPVPRTSDRTVISDGPPTPAPYRGTAPDSATADAAKPVRLVMLGARGQSVAEQTLQPGDVLEIGRGTGEPWSDDNYLEPQHANLSPVPGGVRVDEATPRSGIYRQLAQRAVVRDGDQFRVGQSLIGYARASEPHAPPLGRVTVLVNVQGSTESFPVGAAGLLIGREEGDITFPADTYVSGEHCRISVAGEQLYIEDLDSSNGTYVRVRNGETVEFGSLLLMGHTQFKLRPG